MAKWTRNGQAILKDNKRVMFAHTSFLAERVVLWLNAGHRVYKSSKTGYFYTIQYGDKPAYIRVDSGERKSCSRPGQFERVS